MGDYRVFKEVLGHSEFGTVYYGEDFNQNKYAIKVYSKKKSKTLLTYSEWTNF